MNETMKEPSERIIPFSSEYTEQVITLIDSTLRAIGVLEQDAPPIDDDDLNRIDEVYGKNGGFWVAVDGDHVVGTVAVRDAGDQIALLNRMFVDMQRHGSGIGQRLFDHALQFARSHGYTDMILNTHEKMTRAHRFYEKNGFTQVRKIGDKFRYIRPIQ